MLSREQLLKLCDLNTKEIDVPAFGGLIRIRELTVEDVSRIYRDVQESNVSERGYQDIIRTVAAGVVDESNAPVFTIEQVSGLSRRFSQTVVDIYHAIGELSAVTKVEELEKNSEPALIANS
jgi:hypothetical protein